MSKEDTDIVTINIPLRRVYAQESACDIKNKRLKEKVCERSTRNPSAVFLTKYALSKYNSLIQDNGLKDLILPYRLYERNVAKITRKHRLAIELEEKYKIAYTELRKRLHIDDPLDDVLAVTDFRYLNKHLRTECRPLYKSLKFLYHKQIRAKQEIGYRRDDILNIETSHKRQLRNHQDSIQIYKEQVKLFDAFISEDYEKSITCMKKSETLYSNLIDAKNLELLFFASKQFSIQSKLIGIDYLYRQQQKYGRFLYYISPHNWRAKHRDFACSVEIEAKGFNLGTSSEEDTFNVIFENIKKECASGLIKPALYFSQPDDLMNIFESTEKRQLHHFTHVAQLKQHTIMLKKLIKNLKTSIQNDAAFVAHVIGDFEKLLSLNDERASHLEAKFMKILNSSFFDSVAATDVIQLQMNLEWCFEMIFREKSNTTIGSTAKALEDMFMEYAYKLDIFDNNETKAALKQSVVEDKNRMKIAHMAARELRLFDRLEKSLLRAHVNDTVVVAPLPVVKRSAVSKQKAEQKAKPAIRRSSQRQLTDAEIEYLRLFTDWTEKDNPAKYLHTL